MSQLLYKNTVKNKRDYNLIKATYSLLRIRQGTLDKSPKQGYNQAHKEFVHILNWLKPEI